MAEKAQDKKHKNPAGKGEEHRGQKPGEKSPPADYGQKKGNDNKKKW